MNRFEESALEQLIELSKEIESGQADDLNEIIGRCKVLNHFIKDIQL